MKVPAILSVLLATALAAAVHAALASTSVPLPAPTSIPSPGSSRNGTLSPDNQSFTTTDNDALRAAIAHYDFKAAAPLVEQYYDAVYGNNTFARTNAVSKAAAASTDILPFCVGIAWNPTRVQIFKNKMSCDVSDWTTLFVFTAHTREDDSHAAYPICSGLGSGPGRSMLFSDKKSCSLQGFKADFVFYESGIPKRNRDKTDLFVNPAHESTVMWQKFNPHRMVIYPGYDGASEGWERAYNLQYRFCWRLATEREAKSFKRLLSTHAIIHKRIKLTSIPNNPIYRRCLQLLIQTWDFPSVTLNKSQTYYGSSRSDLRQAAERNGCLDIAIKSGVRVARTSEYGVTSIELMVMDKVYVAVSVRSGIVIDPNYVQIAMQESFRTGQHVAISFSDVFERSVVAFVAGTFVAIGPSFIYNARI
ncbi:hypothetical protein BGX29_009689 [Mortierella sp. GBA35]|nr:hypothetical protein BGX29_009689 [Mortierella sp. GBA35]